MNKLPVISLKEAERNNTADSSVTKALREYGFFYLTDHGISPSLTGEIERLSKLFFNMSKTEKRAIHMKNAGIAWRGYFEVGAELTAGNPDIKEGLYFGVEQRKEHPLVQKKTPMHGENQWPESPDLKDFQRLVTTYQKQMKKLSETLLEIVGRSLGLKHGYFLERFQKDPTLLFRIFNYPATSDMKGDYGVGEHTDMGFLTILRQDHQGGLQVKMPDGSWIDAPPVDDTFVINIGDMLEYWTHGILKATPHRVKAQTKSDRLSFPFFYDPSWNAPLARIPKEEFSCRVFTEDTYLRSQNQKRWDGLDLHEIENKTYGEFVWNKVKNVFPWLADESP